MKQLEVGMHGFPSRNGYSACSYYERAQERVRVKQLEVGMHGSPLRDGYSTYSHSWEKALERDRVQQLEELV